MISKLSCLRLPTKSTSRARTAESIPCSSGVEVCHSFVGQDCELSFACAGSQSSRPDIKINTVKSADRVFLGRLIATSSSEMTYERIISDLAKIKSPTPQRTTAICAILPFRPLVGWCESTAPRLGDESIEAERPCPSSEQTGVKDAIKCPVSPYQLSSGRLSTGLRRYAVPARTTATSFCE